MAFIKGADLDAIRSMIEAFMANGDNFTDGTPRSVDIVATGADAWNVAHRAGVTSYCYGDSSRDLPGIDGCVDAHIKTALAGIFPNAVFKDRYGY